MRLYCVFDEVANEIVNVFPSHNDETAERSFLMLLSAPQDSLFTLFPQQFSLRFIGDFSVPQDIVKKGLEYSAAELQAERIRSSMIRNSQSYDKVVSDDE